jgi:hypothetical protein
MVRLNSFKSKPASLLKAPLELSKSRADIYDPKTLAAMDQAFAAVWHMLGADEPFRDYANDTELKKPSAKSC